MEEFKNISSQESALEILNRKISDIEPIGESRNIEIKNREDLKGLIEAPLLSACQELYDKNIRTLSSSANKQDIHYGSGHIVIDFDTLSDANKEIAATTGEVTFADNMNCLDIKIPLTTESTFDSVQAFTEKIAHKFEKQDYSVATYTIQDLRKIHGIDENDESFGPESFQNFYYSTEYDLFFLSKEQFKKATEVY